MATATLTKPAAKGGSFLLESPQPGDVFTPADLTDDQRLIGQTAEEFVLKEVFPLIKDLENKKAGLMPALVKKGGEVGLMGGGVPEEYGGAGLDKIATTVLTEKLSIYGGFAVTHGAHAGIGTLPIVYFGTEAQKKKYLPKLATGEWIGAYCLSEPQAGSDAQNSLTRAELNPEGTHYILNGQKMWITNGGFADIYIVFAKIDGEKFTAFIVERTFPGFKPGNEEHKMGIHGSSTTPIFLENCKVPKENLLHEIGRGHIVAFNILNAGRFTLGASCVGGSKHVLMTSSKYCKERKAFGKQIGEFGMMKEKLAEMAIQIFAVESMVYRSAGNIEAAMAAASGSGDKIQNTMKVLEEYAIESSIAKVYGSEMLDFVVDEGVQIFGGYGFHEEYPVCRAYRDSRINRIFEGTNEINRMLIIQMLMKRAMGGQLALIPAAMKLADEILAGPSFEEAPEGVLADEARVVANCQENVSAGGRRRRAEVPRKARRRTGTDRRAFERGHGNLRDGILPASRAESRRGQGRIRNADDDRRRARLHQRRRRARRARSQARHRRGPRRRHAHHANGRAEALRKARAGGHHRAAPPRRRRRAVAGPLLLRRPLEHYTRPKLETVRRSAAV